MGCDFFELPDGTRGVCCSHGRKPAPTCASPGCRLVGEFLCDYPTKGPNGEPKTCDRRMCALHRHPVGDDCDYCPPHYRQFSVENRIVGRIKVPR
jgi:hypothetical protein